jgi:heptosyltransferase-2
MELAVSEQDRQLAESFYRDQGLSWTAKTVLFNTSSATAESRLWPVGHASRAARELAIKHGIQVVVHCGPSDRERANAVAFGAAHPMVRSMGTYEHLPIGLSKGVIEHADVVVSTDSGPRHMAVALNRPVVSLFGPTSPKTTQTYNSPETILQLSMDCRPCGKVKCPLTHNNCMHGLTYPAVVKAILSRMDIPSYSEKPGGYSEEPGSARLKLPTA